MGIVGKQSIWNIITLFIGVLLGAVNTMILFPLVLFPEEYGLTRILVTVSILSAQFAMMGMPSVLIKFLHKFRKKKGSSYGLFNFVLTVCIVGSLIVVVCLYFGKSLVLHPYENGAKSFSDNYILLFPLVFFMVLIEVFSIYLRAIFHSVFQLIVSEIFIRLFITLILLLSYFGIINFDLFILLFVLAYGFNVLLLITYLIRIGEFDLKLNKSVLTKKNKATFFKYGIANFFSGIGFQLSNMIDVLMIGSMIGASLLGGDEGLKAVAIYSMAAYMSSVVEIPSKAIGSIAISLIGKAWVDKNMDEIQMLYRKTSINQLIAGGLIFIGIWVNIDSVVLILSNFSKDSYDFSQIKYVVFFLGVSKLFHIASGINGGIIMTSKYYILGTYVTIGLVFITFFTNLIFIPMYGVVGAAIATAISLLLFNIISFLFLFVKFNLQPFTLNTLLAIIIGFLAYLAAYFFPEIENPYINILVQSCVVMIIYIPLIIRLKISEDFTALANKISGKLGLKSIN